MNHQNHEKLISEKDGSEIAGVSAETLRQYRSIGILQGVEQAGEVFYSRDELAAVFFIRPQQPSRDHGFQPLSVTSAAEQAASTAQANTASTADATKSPGLTTSPVSIGEIAVSRAVYPELAVRQDHADTGDISSGPISTGSNTNSPGIGAAPAGVNITDIDPPYQQQEAQGSAILPNSALATPAPEVAESKPARQVVEEPNDSKEASSGSSTAKSTNEGNPGTTGKTADIGPDSVSEHFNDKASSFELPYPIQSISASRVPATIDPETSQLTRSLREQIEMLREERDWLRTR